MRAVLLCLIFLMPPAVWAQSGDGEELGAIRAELGALNAEIGRLRAELQTPGLAAQQGIANTGPLLQRLDALEAAQRELTAEVEQVEFAVRQVVEDGTRRIGDLEFRLVELEGGDVSQLGATPPLGGELSLGDGGAVTALPDAQPGGGVQLAVSEQADFDAAYAAYEAGSYADAADKFQAFVTNYPGGPLSGDAAFWRGEALAAQGDWREAARSYLDSFSGAPQGDKAPEALVRLGISLGKIGQTEQACLTFNEVGKRYPSADPALLDKAQAEKGTLGCV